MNYDINKLNSSDFEFLSQSILTKITGNGIIGFGDGPDGGREATYEGKANYPSEANQWDGYWVMQAKFRIVKTHQEGRDFNWLKNEIYKELKKYDERAIKVKLPDNLIFFTNIILTPSADSGGRDMANTLILKLQKDFKIKNISIISSDEINIYLNTYRDIAIAFSGFILPGDVLTKLYQLLEKNEREQKDINKYLGRYLEAEFKNNIASKLEHAGKLTSDKINLERVFIDLFATPDGNVPTEPYHKFISYTVFNGNQLLKPSLKRNSRFVLIAGPGYGKSTLTQFLTQYYSSYYLKNIDKNENLLPELNEFFAECENIIKVKPVCLRIPFRIILKDYAGWIITQEVKGEDYSIISYLKSVMNKRCGGQFFGNYIIEELISKSSTLFVFDGLDEVPSSSNRLQVIEELNQFTDIILRRFDTDSLIIGTSRPQGYTKEFNSAIYKHLIITDLTPDDSYDYVSRLLRNIETDNDKRKKDLEILKRASQDNIVSRLMKSPLQASIMTILVISGGEPPRNKYELFYEYYTTIFKREKQKDVARILIEHPTYINEIHKKLGFTLQVSSESKSSPSSTIAITDFQKFIDKYLKEDVQLSLADVDSVAAQIIDASIKRLVFIEEVQDGYIGFNIRSIQEYFAATYFIDAPDAMIKSKLREIASPSYWNNTLMFCIGYLFKNKKYAIDYVESVCNELNGSTESYDKDSLPSLYFHGSWLSVDILNEAIFRGHPIYENKFSKNIENLLLIPFFNKHLDLIKLPENIKLEWLLNYVNKGLQSTDRFTNYTCWHVIMLLIGNGLGYSDKEYLTLWNNTINRKELFNLLARKSLLENTLGIKCIIDILNSCDSLEYHTLIIRHPPEFIAKIIKESNSLKVKSEILLSYFVDYYYVERNPHNSKTVSVIDELSKVANIDKKVKGFFEYFNRRTKGKTIKFSILDAGYSGEIWKIFVDDKEYIDALARLGKFYQIAFLETISEFFDKPTKATLIKLLKNLYSLGERVKLVIKRLRNMNWLFHLIFEDDLLIDDIILKVDSGRYGDENDWKEKEEFLEKNKNNDDLLIEYLKFTGFRSMTLNDERKVFNKLIEWTKESKKNECYREIFRLIDWDSFDNLTGKQFKKLNEEQESIMILAFEEVFINFDAYKDSISFYSIYPAFKLISEKNILEHSKLFHAIFNKLDFESREAWFVPGIEQLDDEYQRVLNLYSLLSKRTEDHSIIRVIPFMLTQSFVHPLIETPNFLYSINIDKLKDNKNIFSICCALVINLNKTNRDLKVLENLLQKVIFDGDEGPCLMKIFLTIIERFNVNRNIDTIILILKSNLFNNYALTSQFLSVTKSITESKASLI